MENKIKVLKALNISHKAKSKMDYKRLEFLINTEVINPDFINDAILFSEDLRNLLDLMVSDGLINSDENKWYFSITSLGINYLENS